MRRIVNFRAPLFIVIGLIFGIYSFYEFLYNEIVFGIVAFAVFLALCIVLLCLKRKTWKSVFVILLSMAIGLGVSALSYKQTGRNEAFGEEKTVTGRVTDIARNGEEDNAVVYLEACTDSDGKKYDGIITAYLFDYVPTTGDVVTVRGKIYSVYPVNNKSDVYYLRLNVRYRIIDADFLSYESGGLKLDETVRKYVYDVATDYALDNGAVIYALFTGDRNAIDSDTVTAFKSSGILHLLAVSGLHVGFIVAILTFFLKRLSLHPLIEGAIVLLPLLIFAYVCGFSPSVVRAVLMTACVYVSRAIYGRYDVLSSLSCAALLILLFSPFYLFDVGFQLSFLSVFGIATVYSAVGRLLNKRKIHKAFRYIINSLSVSASCALATFFVTAVNFGEVPVLGILLNVIAVPLVSVAFALGFVSLLPSVFHYVAFVADKIIGIVVACAEGIASLSFATVTVAAFSVSTLVVAAWLFVIGGYVNLNKIGKIAVHSSLAVILALCVGLAFVPSSCANQAYVRFGYDDIMCVVTSESGEALISGNFSDKGAFAYASDFLKTRRISACSLYITEYCSASSDLIEDALNEFPVAVAYRLDFSGNDELDALFSEYGVEIYQQAKNTVTGERITVRSVYDGTLRGVALTADKLSVSVVYGEDYAVSQYLSLYSASDVYVMKEGNEAYSRQGYTTLSMYQSALPYNYGANKYGNFTITQKGDKIRATFR
ncbi:MAG: ComEC family competence protein [Corallococcus sp.]|nr:ComEC family competence protein [Bacillota bacterium]MCM1533685.1 ComEC family competence protein [Corallococcus sp.]